MLQTFPVLPLHSGMAPLRHEKVVRLLTLELLSLLVVEEEEEEEYMASSSDEEEERERASVFVRPALRKVRPRLASQLKAVGVFSGSRRTFVVSSSSFSCVSFCPVLCLPAVC